MSHIWVYGNFSQTVKPCVDRADSQHPFLFRPVYFRRRAERQKHPAIKQSHRYPDERNPSMTRKETAAMTRATMKKQIPALIPLLALALLILCPLVHGAFAADKPEAPAREAGECETAEPAQPEPPERIGVFTMTSSVTAYCPCVVCCGEHSAEHPNNAGTDFVQRTASGTVPTMQRTIAVDPNVIPMGSYVMIGNAVYIAEDTGSCIDGSDIDIFMSSHEQAREFGTKELTVTVYTPEHFALQESKIAVPERGSEWRHDAEISGS